MPVFFLALLSLPLLEIAVLVAVGSQIGILATLALVIATGILGSYLLRAQGLSALANLRRDLRSGQAPDRKIAEAAMIVLAGIMLIIPGFVSDVIGIALFIPFVRSFIVNRLANKVTIVRPQSGHYEDVVDLDASEYQRTDEDGGHAKRDPNSPWRLPNDKRS